MVLSQVILTVQSSEEEEFYGFETQVNHYLNADDSETENDIVFN